MAIQLQCACGQALLAGEEQVGLMVQCPRCGAAVGVPPPGPVQPGYASPLTPPPGAMVRAPTLVPDNFRSPGLPACYLIFSVEHARLNARFDVSPALQEFVNCFAKKSRKQFDVQVASTAPEGSPAVFVRLLFVEEGNRWMRYFFALFAGKTILEIDGEMRSATGQRATFHETHKGAIGIFGGDSLGLLKVSGKYLGRKLAKRLMKMS